MFWHKRKHSNIRHKKSPQSALDMLLAQIRSDVAAEINSYPKCQHDRIPTTCNECVEEAQKSG